ncbi:MAG TPA: phosphoserine phosphatase SerB [Burkholderiaceae bacterium]
MTSRVEPADLVVQAPDLAPAAIADFRDRFAAAQLRRQPASVRLIGVGRSTEIAAQVLALATTWRCDAALVPPQWMLSEFRLLAIDMDSTLIQTEGIDEVAQLAGVGPQVAAITDAAMRGQLGDYSDSLRQRVALLAGVDQSLLRQVAQQRMRLSPGAERLLQAARQAGLRSLLVTGGFDYFANILQRRLGIDSVRANAVQIRDGRLTGTVHGPADTPEVLVDSQGKANALKRACAEAGCSPAQAIAIGDGANDLPMLQLARLGIAYHAKPLVRESAGYSLDFSGLDGVLEWFTDTALTPAPLARGGRGAI